MKYGINQSTLPACTPPAIAHSMLEIVCASAESCAHVKQGLVEAGRRETNRQSDRREANDSKLGIFRDIKRSFLARSFVSSLNNPTSKSLLINALFPPTHSLSPLPPSHMHSLLTTNCLSTSLKTPGRSSLNTIDASHFAATMQKVHHISPPPPLRDRFNYLTSFLSFLPLKSERMYSRNSQLREEEEEEKNVGW